jgi:hypothetical protein
MNDALFFLLSGFALGGACGLWLGFKLWKQTYVHIPDNVRRWHG